MPICSKINKGLFAGVKYDTMNLSLKKEKIMKHYIDLQKLGYSYFQVKFESKKESV